ncbi:MAG: 3-deoxy-D-manno-octulosonic acid transferase, partial [Bacteroidota bacterium]
AKLWINGRKNWKENLKLNVEKLDLQNSVWIHCASLGEFEQGRPVIEKIKAEHPSSKIVLTFFSPSGYEVQKNYSLADFVCYLPLDTKLNANAFLSILKPKISIFVKYEFWLNFLFQLKEHGIPTYLISTVIKKHQLFFKWYGNNFRKALSVYTTIFTQDPMSLKFLKKLKIETGRIAGDTRFDRVLEISKSPNQLTDIDNFAKNSFVLIAGSTWQKDEELLIETFLKLKPNNPSLKLIIAPHEVDSLTIDKLKNLLFKNNLSFHLFSDNDFKFSHSILVLDTIGVLSSVYQYGHIAFIGGGFNTGIHNLLEASVFGLPVLFGPNHHKFNEAKQLLELKAGFQILNQNDLVVILEQFLTDSEYLKSTSNLAKSYIINQSGATNLIYLELSKNFI